MMLDAGRLERLAAEFGTPMYVYDLAEVRRAHADLRAAVPRGTDVFYSLKANPHPGVVRELVRAGVRAEVCSQRELDIALAAGADAAACLYTGPGKTSAELDHALAAGVRRFSVDSPTDLARLAVRARRTRMPAEAVLRLNPVGYPRNAGLAMGGTNSQFGADVAWVCAEPDRFRADGVELVGYHVYIGSNITDVDQLTSWFEAGLDAARQAQKALGAAVRLIDLGGGFGHPYARSGERPLLAGLAERLAALLDEHLGSGELGEPTVAFESGRYLACAAGSLLLGVQDVKSSHGVRYVVADGGINVLGGMQGLRRIPPSWTFSTSRPRSRLWPPATYSSSRTSARTGSPRAYWGSSAGGRLSKWPSTAAAPFPRCGSSSATPRRPRSGRPAVNAGPA